MTRIISKFDVWMVALQLKEPFRFAYGTFEELPRVLIRVEVDLGSLSAVGWGEAAIDFPFVNYDMLDVYDALSKVGSEIVGMNLEDQRQILCSDALNFLSIAPAARCALNMALDDVIGHARGQSAGHIYGFRRSAGVPLCSVGFDQSGDPEAWLSAPGIIKIKVGQGISQDLKNIKLAERIAKEIDKQYALDFNAAYAVEELFELIEKLRGVSCWGTESCVVWEQPIDGQAPIADWIKLVKVFANHEHAAKLIADESFISASVGKQLVDIGIGLNYKIQKFGGILAAVELENSIRDHTVRIKSFIGGTFPSPLGRAYDTLASRVIPSADLPGDGLLPASTYLSPDCVAAFTATPDLVGLGVRPNEAALSRLIVEDPIEEFYRIRTGKRPERIKMDVGGSYAERYISLSGRSLLWNIRK